MDDRDALLHRAVEAILPTEAAFAAALDTAEKEGRRLRGYLGIDPTSPHMHIGHSVAMRNLARFQRAGHQAILLIGDFTGRLGDPDKLSTRVPLTKEQVQANMATYLDQAKRILDFDGDNPVEIRYNSKWSDPMTFEEVVKLAAHFTVQQMLERDMFQRRLQEQRPISLSEFFYPLMQGYDAVVLEADVQFGGTDQTFNMLAGRTLNKALRDKEMFVVANPLLADANGVKIGKTMGNAINIDNPPDELYGQVMSLPDEVIVPGFRLLTEEPIADIEEIERNIAAGENPIKYKSRLAFTIVSQFSSTVQADEAQVRFTRTVRRGEFDDQAEERKLARADWLIVDLLSEIGAVDSRSEGRRLLEQGAVEVNGATWTQPSLRLDGTATLKVGKRRFYKLTVA